LEGRKSGNASKVDITFTNLTHTTADGFTARVVKERTNNIYYFGEAATQYQNGQVVGNSGSWESGVNGAHFGMLMPGTVLLGARFQQEVAPGIALDQITGVQAWVW